MAEEFNNFFLTIAESLVNKLPQSSGKFGNEHVKTYYRNLDIQEESFALSPVSKETVLKMLNAVDKSKATGLDNISAHFLSDASEIISPCITHIINLSLSSGEITMDLKFAKVTPLYKKGSKLQSGNYRPVSVLSIISKIMEKVVYEQVSEYIQEKNILYDLQSGFRRSFSTDTCLIYLTDYIRKEIDSGNFCGMVMLDLQKAFDTVDHHIL